MVTTQTAMNPIARVPSLDALKNAIPLQFHCFAWTQDNSNLQHGSLASPGISPLISAAMAQTETGVVRIGFQKAGPVLLSLKAKRTLEVSVQGGGAGPVQRRL
jgi:hypothetical protein